jgi:tetratricopeptide (TPR) repeat protein
MLLNRYLRLNLSFGRYAKKGHCMDIPVPEIVTEISKARRNLQRAKEHYKPGDARSIPLWNDLGYINEATDIAQRISRDTSSDPSDRAFAQVFLTLSAIALNKSEHEEEITQWTQNANLSTKGFGFYARGLLLIKRRDLLSAAEAFKHAALCFEESGDEDYALKAHVSILTIARMEDRTEEARQITSHVFPRAVALGAAGISCILLLLSADVCFAIGDGSKYRARQIANQVRKLIKALEDGRTKGFASFQIGRTLWELGNQKEALSSLIVAQRIQSKFDTLGLVSTKIQLLQIYVAQKDWALAKRKVSELLQTAYRSHFWADYLEFVEAAVCCCLETIDFDQAENIIADFSREINQNGDDPEDLALKHRFVEMVAHEKKRVRKKCGQSGFDLIGLSEILIDESKSRIHVRHGSIKAHLDYPRESLAYRTITAILNDSKNTGIVELTKIAESLTQSSRRPIMLESAKRQIRRFIQSFPVRDIFWMHSLTSGVQICLSAGVQVSNLSVEASR